MRENTKEEPTELTKLINWRTQILSDRIQFLESYLRHRARFEKDINELQPGDLVIRYHMEVRKWADQLIFRPWLEILKVRKSLLSLLPKEPSRAVKIT